ncbi:hypothetical protein Tco_0995679 [Tanacetum coccineum]
MGKGIEGTLQELTVIVQDTLSSSDKEKIKELTVTDPTPSSSSPKPITGRFRQYKSFIKQMDGRYGYLFGHLKKTFMPRKKFHKLAATLQSTMKEVLPLMVDSRVNEIAKKTVPDICVLESARVDSFLRNYMSNNIPHVHPTQAADHKDHHDDDARPEGESSAKRQKTSEHGTYLVGESSSEQAMDQEPNPSSSCTQEQLDEFSAWVDDFGTDDDEVPTEEESRKERLPLPTPEKPTPVYHSCQKDPKAPPMILLNQDLLYLKYGNSEPKKFTLSLHKANKNDIEDLYLLCINGKVKDYRETSKKEKRVMILKEIPKFCDANLKRVLEMMKKHNKDVKYEYANPSPIDAYVEYLQFYKEDIEERLKHHDQMRQGSLPVKYLSVPLVSSRLIFRDCKELLEKVQIRVDDWKNKSLSIAGRLQLVKSVLGSLHAKVAWNVVCLPMDEGGLGIRRLNDFNKALMTTQVWKLLVRKELLWVEWIHVYKLRGRSFWDIPYRGNLTWGWRNVLKLRPLIREFIWKKLGNGLTTSVWFDRWCIQSPLADLISSGDIFREGFNKETKVCDLVINGVLDWPTSWLSKYPSLNAIVSPVLVPNSHDLLEWRNEDGLVCSFLAHTVWNTIRARGTKVWNQVKGVAGLASSNASIYDIIHDIIPFAARKTSKSVIAKLVVAATSYFIWQERNGRVFKNMKRTVNQVVECIMNTVWLKLMSCRLKKSRSACDIVKARKLSEGILIS